MKNIINNYIKINKSNHPVMYIYYNYRSVDDWEFAGCSFCYIIINNYVIYKNFTRKKNECYKFLQVEYITDCAVQILYLISTVYL